jgi:hypothetical protein
MKTSLMRSGAWAQRASAVLACGLTRLGVGCLAIALVDTDAKVSAQSCSDLIIEASIPVPSNAGEGTLAIDGPHIWVSQGALALRYAKVGGTWTIDAFLDVPQFQSPERLSAANNRVIVGNSIFDTQDGLQLIGTISPWPNSCSSDGPRLGDHFVAYGYDCLNLMVKGVAQGGSGQLLARPPYPPNQPVGGYSIRARSNHVYVANTGFGGLPFNVVRSTIGGTAVSTTITSVSSFSGGPPVTMLHDYVPTDSGVAAVIRSVQQPSSSSRHVVALHDGGSWIVADTPFQNDYAPYYIAFASGTVYVYAGGEIYEVERTAGEALRFKSLMTLTNCLGLAGEGSLLAARVRDDSVASKVRLVVLRVRGFVDCNANALDDCAEIAAGTLTDSNSNGVPDTCECLADVNASGTVNGIDLATVLGAWGTNGEGDGDADINSDGIVNGVDLAMVLAGWGPCP